MTTKQELSNEWKKPKAKNAKPGQEPRDYEKIKAILEIKNSNK